MLELCREYNHIGVVISLRSEACDHGLFRPLIVILRRLPGEARTEDEIGTETLLAAMDAADAEAVILPASLTSTGDLVPVNGVSRPDVTGNRQTGGIGVRRKPLSPLLRQPPERLGRGTTLKAAFNVFADA